MTYRACSIKTWFDHMVIPYLVPEGMQVEKGKWYLVATRFGDDLGLSYTGLEELPKEKFQLKKAGNEPAGDPEIDDVQAQAMPADAQADAVFFETQKVLRAATEAEVTEYKKGRAEENAAYEQAKAEIRDLKLDMKLVNVHYMFQKKKLIFNFTAETRVDFRSLVKKLAGTFKTRIEMRQIGVRDSSKIEGGYGVCGQINCCRRSNCHINSIYLKMGKDQGFVVNSAKLTGSCGRLMCCLAYEVPFYQEESKKFPEQGAVVTSPDNKVYHVGSNNILKRDVYLVDEFRHQKKVPLDHLKFLKKQGRQTHWQYFPATPVKEQIAGESVGQRDQRPGRR